MINLAPYQGKKIAVIGLGKTGLSAATALRAAGAIVALWDDQFEARNKAAAEGHVILSWPDESITAFDLLVWSPGIAHTHPIPHPIAVAARAENIPIISDVELLCKVQNEADFIGITGTNGKSTTTALIGHILNEFRPTEIGGNIGTPVLGLKPLGKDGTYVVEMSSYQLELTPSFSPVAAVLLNITPDHLARHGGIGGYVAAKKAIFSNPLAKPAKPIAVICVDTDPCREIADMLTDEGIWHVIPVSTRVSLQDGVSVENGKMIDRKQGKIVFEADLYKMQNLKGQHNHENAACAYAAIHGLYAYNPSQILAAMQRFAGLQHRQFLVRSIGNVVYINDSKATNADATEKALASFDNIYWILGGQPKEGGLEGLQSFMGRIAHAYLIGEAATQFAEWLHQHNVKFSHCGTIDKAVALAHQDAQAANKHGVVLLSPACASWDQFQSFEHRGQVFTNLVNALEG